MSKRLSKNSTSRDVKPASPAVYLSNKSLKLLGIEKGNTHVIGHIERTKEFAPGDLAVMRVVKINLLFIMIVQSDGSFILDKTPGVCARRVHFPADFEEYSSGAIEIVGRAQKGA